MRDIIAHDLQYTTAYAHPETSINLIYTISNYPNWIAYLSTDNLATTLSRQKLARGRAQQDEPDRPFGGGVSRLENG